MMMHIALEILLFSVATVAVSAGDDLIIKSRDTGPGTVENDFFNKFFDLLKDAGMKTEFTKRAPQRYIE